MPRHSTNTQPPTLPPQETKFRVGDVLSLLNNDPLSKEFCYVLVTKCTGNHYYLSGYFSYNGHITELYTLAPFDKDYMRHRFKLYSQALRRNI